MFWRKEARMAIFVDRFIVGLATFAWSKEACVAEQFALASGCKIQEARASNRPVLLCTPSTSGKFADWSMCELTCNIKQSIS